MAVQKETCPYCGADCKLMVDLDSAITAKLDDRFMALTPISARVICTECEHSRDATIDGFDVNLDSGRLEFGTIQFND